MKAKPGFKLREVCGEQIIVAEGKENIDFSNIISMNESSAYLWERIQDKDFTIDDLANLLLEQYEVDVETAKKDVTTLAAQWGKAGIIEGNDIPQIDVTFAKPAFQDSPDATDNSSKKGKKGFFSKLLKR